MTSGNLKIANTVLENYGLIGVVVIAGMAFIFFLVKQLQTIRNKEVERLENRVSELAKEIDELKLKLGVSNGAKESIEKSYRNCKETYHQLEFRHCESLAREKVLNEFFKKEIRKN